LVTLALDTNIIIALVRNKDLVVRQHFGQALLGDEPLVASLIVLHELLLGCELYHDPEGERRRVNVVLANVLIDPLNEADITAAAHLTAKLAKQGAVIGPFDRLIAGQALARDWTLVTANKREFERVDGLNVIDWTTPAD